MINIIGDKKKILYRDYSVNYENSLELKKREEIIKNEEKASLISDTMFKAMFYNEKRLKYSAKLLSYIIDISYQELLNKIRLGENELDKEKEFSKGERCDYVAEVNGTYLNIEMNCNDSDYLMDRNMEYAYRLFTSSNTVGEGYHYNQLIQVNLNNFSFNGLDEVMYIEGMETNEYRQTNNLIIIQIFIPNIYKKCYNQGKESLNELERFILSMVTYNIDDAKGFALEDEVMKDYIEESEQVTFNNGFGEAYDKEWAVKNWGIREGKEEGIKIGLEEGRREGRREGHREGHREGLKEGQKKGYNNAKKEDAVMMLKKNIDRETISEITGLSLEEIEKLNID